MFDNIICFWCMIIAGLHHCYWLLQVFKYFHMQTWRVIKEPYSYQNPCKNCILTSVCLVLVAMQWVIPAQCWWLNHALLTDVITAVTVVYNVRHDCWLIKRTVTTQLFHLLECISVRFPTRSSHVHRFWTVLTVYSNNNVCIVYTLFFYKW